MNEPITVYISEIRGNGGRKYTSVVNYASYRSRSMAGDKKLYAQRIPPEEQSEGRKIGRLIAETFVGRFPEWVTTVVLEVDPDKLDEMSK